MKQWFALPLLLVAACSGGAGGNGSDTAQAAPVAAVKPPAGQQWTDVVSETPESGYRVGNPDAPVKMVEYGARLCPGCKQLSDTGFDPLMKDYVSTGKVSFEFRDFMIHGAPELALAALGRCGGGAPFFPLLEQMYADQNQFNDRAQQVTQAQLAGLEGKPPATAITFWANAIGAIDYVKQRGIPEAKARQCVGDAALIEKIGKITQDAGSDVTSTPTVLINGQKVDEPSWAGVKAALARAGA
jgi:protein-disulfide isomerase